MLPLEEPRRLLGDEGGFAGLMGLVTTVGP